MRWGPAGPGRKHGSGNLGRARAEFLRQQRQNCLRRVEIDEGAIASEPGCEPQGKGVSCFCVSHTRGPGARLLLKACIGFARNATSRAAGQWVAQRIAGYSTPSMAL